MYRWGRGLVGWLGLVLGEAEAENAVAEIREVVVAGRRTHPQRMVDPGSAAEGILLNITCAFLLASIVGILVLRAGPLPDIALHVLEPKGVRGKALHWSGLLVVPEAAAPPLWKDYPS